MTHIGKETTVTLYWRHWLQVEGGIVYFKQLDFLSMVMMYADVIPSS